MYTTLIFIYTPPSLIVSSRFHVVVSFHLCCCCTTKGEIKALIVGIISVERKDSLGFASLKKNAKRSSLVSCCCSFVVENQPWLGSLTLLLQLLTKD